MPHFRPTRTPSRDLTCNVDPNRRFLMKTIAFAALLPIALSAVPRVSTAQDTLVVQYAAKLLCGGSNRRGVAPGRYFTAVNVHNPYRDSVLFRYKFALTRPNAVPGPITPWTGATLKSDQ